MTQVKMNRAMRRSSEKAGRAKMKKGWDEFKDVTQDAIKKHIMLGGNYETLKNMCNKIYMNNLYTAQLYYKVERGGELWTRVMCRRNDSKAQCSWQDLYRIKNELFGDEIEAVQFLPKKSELVDEANLYWFFIKDAQDETQDV